MVEIDDIMELANVEQFLKDVDAESTTGQCHQAVVWLATQIKRAQLSDWNVYIATGCFAGRDHSWIVVEDREGDYTIVDMTVDQFHQYTKFKVPYVGPISPGYEMLDSINLCDAENMMDFVERLG